MIKEVQDKAGYEKYDIVTANILADVLVASDTSSGAPVEKGRYLYYFRYSWMTRKQVVVEAVKAAGLTVVEVTHQGEWVSVTARKD